MENEYLKLKEFWNEYFKNSQTFEVAGKWIEDENFNSAIKKYIREGAKVLDFGCGNGWGLIEIAYTVNLGEGIGMDQSEYAVECSNRTVEASNIGNLKFVVGDETTMDNYRDYFDVVFSINTFDVITNEALENVALGCQKVLQKGGYLLVGLNPDYPMIFLEKAGYEKKNGYLIKNDIIRGNFKTTDEWIEFLSKYFTFVEKVDFALTELDKTYPRRMLVLKK